MGGQRQNFDRATAKTAPAGAVGAKPRLCSNGGGAYATNRSADLLTALSFRPRRAWAEVQSTDNSFGDQRKMLNGAGAI